MKNYVISMIAALCLLTSCATSNVKTARGLESQPQQSSAADHFNDRR